MLRSLLIVIALFPAIAAAATVTPWPLPAPANSAQPNLTTSPDGSVLLSWVERDGDGHRLRFARHAGAAADAAWTPVQTIAAGDDWFVNWADFPALAALPDGTLWAHLLVRNGQSTYAYDTRLFRSTDDGAHWQSLGAVHDDGTPTEHGFATLWAQGDGALGIAWLDGRNTGGGGHDGHGAEGIAPEGAPTEAGAMTLRSATFAATGKTDDTELDASTCDCCQTDSAADGDRRWLAWRDRDAREVRDIVVARYENGRWHAPIVVHADGWVMPACPVNGPAIAARDGGAWVAWYTGVDATPQIRLAHSADGTTFAPPLTIARGEQVQGRVDVAADAGGVWVSWLEEAAGRQSLWLARFDPGSQHETLRLKVADVAGRGRGTGFPRLQARAGAAWLVWTELPEGEPRLRGAVVRP
jgi:hypothetical protein